MVFATPLSVAGQAPAALAGSAPAAKASSVPRTPDGRPDLQGVWDFRTITPMQRPTELAGKEVLTDQEAAEFEVKNQRNQDNRESTPAGVVNGQASNRRRRTRLQRLLVGLRQEDRQHEAHVAGDRSARRPDSCA